MDTSTIIETPLIDSSRTRSMRRTDSNEVRLRPRFLLVPIILFSILESVAAIAGFVLGFKAIVSDGKHIQFSWEEYIAISAYEATTIPTSLFDILLLEIIKSLVIVISFLMFRFNYRIRRLSRFRIPIYTMLWINTFYVSRKITHIYSTIGDDSALPIPRSFALGISFTVLIVTAFQLVSVLLFLRSFACDLDHDIRDGLPLSRNSSAVYSSVTGIPAMRYYALIKPEYPILVVGLINLFINCISQLSLPYILGNLVDGLVNKSVGRDQDSDLVYSSLYSFMFVTFLSAITGYIRFF